MRRPATIALGGMARLVVVGALAILTVSLLVDAGADRR